MKISKLTIKDIKAGKLMEALPELYELDSVTENNHWHDNESTYVHTLTVLKNFNKFCDGNKNSRMGRYLNEKVEKATRKDLLTLAILLHDLGKKETRTLEGDVTFFFDHEKISALKARKFLGKAGISAKEKRIISGVIRKHSKLHMIIEDDNKKIESQFERLMRSSGGYAADLVILVMLDTLNGYLKKTMPAKYKFRIGYYQSKLKSMV